MILPLFRHKTLINELFSPEFQDNLHHVSISLPVISHDNISVRFLRAPHHLKYQGFSRVRIQKKKVKDEIR